MGAAEVLMIARDQSTVYKKTREPIDPVDGFANRVAESCGIGVR